MLAAAFLAAASARHAAATAPAAQTPEPFFPGWTQTAPIPDEFRDPETHLRVIHLSRFPSNYAGVVYFTYNNFSADSRYVLIDDQYRDKWRYLYTFDLKTMAVKPLVTDRLTENQVVANSGNVYYQASDAVWVVPITGERKPRKICDLPSRWAPGIGFTVNANETLLIGGSTDTDRSKIAPGTNVDNGPNVLFAVNLKTGKRTVVHRENAWLGHVQFSPTDPDLCMFCHEGNWARVDRIWLFHPSKSTIDKDGTVHSDARIAFHRSEAGEIAGHEFWHPDGKSLWFQHNFRNRADHQTYLTRLDIATGKTIDYTIPPGFGGIHQTFSPDGTFLVSDGSGKGPTGPEKYLSKLTLPTDGSTRLKGEHLASFQSNDYRIEPNPHVSPDNRWVVFTATLNGTPQAYAVELPAK